MSDLVEISAKLIQYLISVRPQIKDNSLQWYLSGSLATMILASVETITDLCLDKNGHLNGENETQIITEEQREKFKKFSRKIGSDIDVVNVNGHLLDGTPLDNRPSIDNIKQHIPDVLDLMSWKPNTAGTCIDCLEEDRKITKHPVCRVKTKNGNVYVTAPPEQLAHKLSETISLSLDIAKGNVSNKEKYEKDIRDLSSMFYGFKDLYDKCEFLDRIFSALNEKDGALFSIYNPIYNRDNAMEAHETLDKFIMRRIIDDSGDYLKSITDDTSDTEIREFFYSLLAKRKKEVEKNIGAKSTSLQQSEPELSL